MSVVGIFVYFHARSCMSPAVPSQKKIDEFLWSYKAAYFAQTLIIALYKRLPSLLVCRSVVNLMPIKFSTLLLIRIRNYTFRCEL